MSIDSIPQRDATDLVCIQLEVHIWSGRRHLDKTDLIHANPEFKKLPEKDLANLGSVKICDPKEIKAFQQLKNKAETILERAGLPFLGAVGVPSQKYPEVFKQLSDLKARYEQLAKDFLNAYDVKIQAWRETHLLANPEWSPLFRDLPTAQHVGGRLAFKFHPYRISAPAEVDQPDLNRAFEDQVHGLKGELLREVANEAKLFVTSLSSKRDNGVVSRRDFVTPKTLGPLRRAAAKLEAFAFIDASIGPLASLVKDLLMEMPDERIDGQQLIVLSTVGRLLSTKSGVDELVQLAISDDKQTFEAIERLRTETVFTVVTAEGHSETDEPADSSGAISVADELLDPQPMQIAANGFGHESDLSNFL